MKILVIGASGVIGSAVSSALAKRHEVLGASYSRSQLKVDLANQDSIRQLFSQVGPLDAVVCVAGRAAYRSFLGMTDADFALSLNNKLMGQINLVRLGLDAVKSGGSFTLTGGTASRHPMPGGLALSTVNAALEGFTRAAALEMPRGIRINVVAPGWVKETRIAYKMEPGFGISAATLADTYVQVVEGSVTGQVVDSEAETKSL